MPKKLYTLKQIASAYEHPITTTRDHIIRLKLKRKFTKKSNDISYSEAEIKQLEKLLEFKMNK